MEILCLLNLGFCLELCFIIVNTNPKQRPFPKRRQGAVTAASHIKYM